MSFLLKIQSQKYPLKQTPRHNATKAFTLHTLHLRYIAAEGGNVVPESMKQKSKTIFPNDIVAKSRAGTNTLQRLNATSTFTLHLTPDQDNTSQNAFVIIIIPYEPEDEDSTGSERVITSEDSSS